MSVSGCSSQGPIHRKRIHPYARSSRRRCPSTHTDATVSPGGEIHDPLGIAGVGDTERGVGPWRAPLNVGIPSTVVPECIRCRREGHRDRAVGAAQD
jgi:hypothetical protein